MVEVGIEEAQSNFVALIERVEQGEEIGILQNGIRIARLVPMFPKAVASIKEFTAALQDTSGLINKPAETFN